MTTPPLPPTSPETDVDRIATAVLSCPSVAALHGGRFGEVAAYLPGRRVVGIRHEARHVAVHVVGRYPASVEDIGTQVRNAVTAVLPGSAGLVVDVTVEDYLDPFPPVAAPPPHKE
ncbi:hypothetical protein [Pseudonocardia hydrocarbonoxydans]|uniref:Asp23/Gls24 family envelope stress response protein n=1 Tax=Pseudonocardia hydrocarbonoxydans TaxID=76726 RepID=A0A4Y3WU14_9PSEU|nr:hypothetical protein [Pseudonocardia hydrocarbonoxydans]GEC22375.1 hypothetical protein PHY01_46580 [Pseudonocardia hydrocarbonoxydans]